MINNSVMKCVICNNEKSGEFITINDKKYHLCCIEQLQNNWNDLKKWLELPIKEEVPVHIYVGNGKMEKGRSLTVIRHEEILDKMQELEGNND